MKAYCTVVRRAKCADWYIPVFELFEKDDEVHVALLRHVAQRNTGSGYVESRDWRRDWSRDKSRDWNASKNGGISRIGVKIVRENELKSRVRNEGKSRDWNGGMTTQETTQQTTQQTTQRMLLKLIPSGNMRNIVSLVMKNPEINIAGMAQILELSQNGIKYHIKQIRKKIAFKHVGPWNAGHWEIGLKETT